MRSLVVVGFLIGCNPEPHLWLDVATVPADLDVAEVRAAMQSAAARWRACGFDVTVDAPDAEVRVYFGPMCGNYAMWEWDEIRLRTDAAWWLSGPCPDGGISLVLTMEHEIGHLLLGSGHSEDPGDVMYGSASTCDIKTRLAACPITPSPP